MDTREYDRANLTKQIQAVLPKATIEVKDTLVVISGIYLIVGSEIAAIQSILRKKTLPVIGWSDKGLEICFSLITR